MNDEKKKLKVSIAIIVVAIVVVAGGICFWWFDFERPHKQAVDNFNVAAQAVTAKNAKLDKALKELEGVISSKEEPLDARTQSDAISLVKESKKEERKIPEIPKTTDELNSEADRLSKPLDYSKTIDELSQQQQILEKSIEQLKQVTEPSQDFVIERLTKVPTVNAVAAATEDHDPNGNLNKAGGYISAIYFESSEVDQSQFSDTDLIEKGTDAGGQIEVYKTKSDAQKRDKYLGTFDGSILASGSHRVIGTCLVRASDKMTATQEQEITGAIISEMTELR